MCKIEIFANIRHVICEINMTFQRQLTMAFGVVITILVISLFYQFLYEIVPDSYRLKVLNTSEEYSISKGEFASEMPDPCAASRRHTGVEDILCMRRPIYLKQYKNPCWEDNGIFRCLPYFHLIGNAKCGTTDFFRRINLHPDIFPNKGNRMKETAYWSIKRLRPRNVKGTLVPRMTFRQFTKYFRGSDIQNSSSIDGYHYKVTCLGDPMDFFDRFREQRLPQNTPGAEELMWTTPFVVKHIQPDLKLLLILRDPIERLYSHYFFGKYGTSSRTFHNHTVESIKVLKTCFALHSIRHCLFSNSVMKQLKTPIYASLDVVHLKEWTKAFPRKQIMIFRNEDYAKDIRGTLIRVFKFVNISMPNDTVLHRMSSRPHSRKTQAKYSAGPMLQETKRLLRKFFQPYVNALAKFLKDDRYLFRDTNFG